MLATKWFRRSAETFKINSHVTPTTVTSPANSNVEIRGVKLALSGPVGSDYCNWLNVTMTPDEARELANRLNTHANIAEGR